MKKFDKIIFDFRDASVPPPYHRSYVISVSHTQVEVKIRDYAQALVEKTFKLFENQWDNLVKLAQDLKEKGEKIAQGATGTSRGMIELSQNNEVIHNFTWDSLQEIEKSTIEFVSAIQLLIPDFEQLLTNS